MEVAIILNDRLNELENYINLGFKNFELDLNESPEYFLENYNTIFSTVEDAGGKIIALGQWGSIKHEDNIINQGQFEIDTKLIEICKQQGIEKFITGFNDDDTISRYQVVANCIDYFTRLQQVAANNGVDICLYNCDWNNFILSENEWNLIIDHIPGLKIKYDPSHAYYRNQDYLKEINQRAKDIGHFHVKGALKLNDMRVDDPPAFLDQLDWKTMISLLYFNQYDGYLSLEPHTASLTHEQIISGVKLTKRKLEDLLIEE